MPIYENGKNIKKGIENALELKDISIERFLKQRISKDGYGIETRTGDFQKMKCCKYICSLDSETLKVVFKNLKTVIEKLIELYSK